MLLAMIGVNASPPFHCLAGRLLGLLALGLTTLLPMPTSAAPLPGPPPSTSVRDAAGIRLLGTEATWLPLCLPGPAGLSRLACRPAATVPSTWLGRGLLGTAPESTQYQLAGLSDAIGHVLLIALLTVVTIGVADLVFTGYDVNQAIQDEPASAGWAAAQLLVATPQAIIFGRLLLEEDGEDSGEAVYLMTVWTTALLLDAIGSLLLVTDTVGRDALPPRDLPLLSLGSATALVGTLVLGRQTFSGRFLEPGPAPVSTTLVSGGVAALSLWQAAAGGWTEGGWIGIGGVTSLLFLHGLGTWILDVQPSAEPEAKQTASTRAGLQPSWGRLPRPAAAFGWSAGF